MSSSTNTAKKEVYGFLKENSKQAFKLLYKLQNNQCFMTSIDFSDLNSHYKENPNLGLSIAHLKHTLYKLNYVGNVPVSVAEYAWEKIRPRFIKYWARRVDMADGHCLQENKTKAIAELIARGFRHKDDAPGADAFSGWVIQCHIAPLVWPIDFAQQTYALQQMEKVGMPGYTGVYTLKKS